MSASTHLLAILCVLMIAFGQVLFKRAALTINGAPNLFDLRVMVPVAVALAVYGLATLLWIALLRHAPLGRLYPYMALSFVFVAVASVAFFGEPVSTGQVLGLALIVGGLVVTAATAEP